jgi:hypothetical protein
MRKQVDFNVLAGKTLVKVQKDGDERILFTTVDGENYVMMHEQDCCEDVHIDDICGDLESLVGNTILEAIESSNEEDTDDGSETWTFYKLATINGWVDIKWHGSSNGFYSESVELYRTDEDIFPEEYKLDDGFKASYGE